MPPKRNTSVDKKGKKTPATQAYTSAKTTLDKESTLGGRAAELLTSGVKAGAKLSKKALRGLGLKTGYLSPSPPNEEVPADVIHAQRIQIQNRPPQLDDDNAQLIVDRQGRSLHEGLVDEEVEISLTEVDGDEYIVAEGKFVKQKTDRSKNNLEYFEALPVIRDSHPYASVYPKSTVPLRRSLKNASLMSKNPKRKLGLTKVTRLTMHNNGIIQRNLLQKRKDMLAEKIRLRIQARHAALKAATFMQREQANNLHLMTLLTDKSLTKAERVASISRDYYMPTNCTSKAISTLIMDLSTLSGEKEVLYNVPKRIEMDNIATMMGFDDLEEFEEDVNIGMLLKNAKNLKVLASADQKKGRGSVNESVINYLEAKDTTAAKRDPELKGFHTLVEFDVEQRVNDEDIDEEQEIYAQELSHVLNESESKFRYRPLVYTAEYSYKILYYIYLNHMGFKLPFGKVVPNLSWIYLFSYYLDYYNSLGLRQSRKNYLYRLGGLGLLEKDEFTKNQPDQNLRELFKNTLTCGRDISTTKNMLVGSTILMIQLQSKLIMLSETRDSFESLQAKMSQEAERSNRLINSRQLGQSIEFESCQRRLETMLGLSEKTDPLSDSSMTEAFSFLNIPYSSRRVLLQDAQAPLSFDVVHTCVTMVSVAKKFQKNPDDSVGWYIRCINDHNLGKGELFSYVLTVMDLANEELLIHMFSSEKNLQLVKKIIAKATSVIESNDSTEYIRITSKNIYQGPLQKYRWSEMQSKMVIQANPALAAIIEQVVTDERTQSDLSVEDEINQTGLTQLSSFVRDDGVGRGDVPEDQVSVELDEEFLNVWSATGDMNPNDRQLSQFIKDKGVRGSKALVMAEITRMSKKQRKILRHQIFSTCVNYCVRMEEDTNIKLELGTLLQHLGKGEKQQAAAILETFKQEFEAAAEKETNPELITKLSLCYSLINIFLGVILL